MEFESCEAKRKWLRENPPECKVPGTDRLKPQGYFQGTTYHPSSYREMGYCQRCPRRGTEFCLFPPDDSPAPPPRQHSCGRRGLGHDAVVEKLAGVLEERGEIKSAYLRQRGSPISYQAVLNHFGGIQAAREAAHRCLEGGD